MKLKYVKMDKPKLKVIVIDNIGGCYFNIAQNLTKYFDVYYHSVVQNPFPRMSTVLVGYGYDNIKLVENFWSNIDMFDLFVFPDIYFQDWGIYLRSIGKMVWGGVESEKLEVDRKLFKQQLSINGLDIAPTKYFSGKKELIPFLQSSEDKWIKISYFRGDMETYHHVNWRQSEVWLTDLSTKLGPLIDRLEFIVEDGIESIAEIGGDGYLVNGNNPDSFLWGIEVKDCYDDQTEVLTNKGWKLFKDLDKSEKIFTLNINKKHFISEFQTPTDWIERDFDGKLINIEKDGVNLSITPTHNILIQRGIQDENGELLNWGDKKFKRGKRIIKLEKAIDVINEGKVFSLFQPRPAYRTNGSEIKVKVGNKYISKMLMSQLLGLYLSEGNTSVSKNYIMISQFKYVDDFEKILSKMPFSFNKIKDGFGCGDKDLVNYLSQFGLSRDKYVPEFIKNSSKEIIESFLSCYCLGDGSFTKNYKSVRGNDSKIKISRKFYTCSNRMADDLQELIVKVGNVATKKVSRNYISKRFGKTNMYIVTEKVINRKNYVFPKDIKYIDYKGKVYCVTVPNGIIMVRRNGISMWCGNCGYVGKSSKFIDMPQPIIDVYNKFRPSLNRYNHTGFYSSEIRVGEDGIDYYTDPCMRAGSPPSNVYMDMITNWDEILLGGARGELIEPKFKGTYGCEIILKSTFCNKNFMPISFPTELKEFIKLKGNILLDNEDYIIPFEQAGIVDMEAFGSVVVIGNDLDTIVNQAMEIVDEIKCYGLLYSEGALDNAKQSIERIEEALNVKF